MLMNITQEAGNGVQGLLDVFFNFLQKRTDFFYEVEPGAQMGFPPEVAESMVSHKEHTTTRLMQDELFD